MNSPRRFRDVPMGAAFQFAPSIDGFFKDCAVYVKTGARTYMDRNGRRISVGSINAAVQAEPETAGALFELHAARAFFGSAWADACDESGPGVGAGVEILDAMPQTLDPAAIHAARTLRMDIERKNGASVAEMLQKIAPIACGDRPVDAEMFGHYAAMQSMGHGVGLCDAFGPLVYQSVSVGYIEFGAHSLSRDYF